MCNGVPNQAVRCFRRLVDSLKARAAAVNPGFELVYTHVQPRNLGELPSRDADLVLSSGGPGSPHDGYDDPWCVGYRAYLDHVVEQNIKDAAHAPKLLGVCHSFELATLHFKVAQMVQRADGRRFGVWPCYPTTDGLKSQLFAPFGDRLFVWENRQWEAVGLDEKKLAALGGRLLARESRHGRTDKGNALLGFDYAPGVVAVQFHPEADREGLRVWVYSTEQATEFKKSFGEPLYQRMIKTLDDPSRVARTFALFVPGWLTDRFNGWARTHELATLPPPEQDLTEFFAAPAPTGTAG
jgi:GMP synthase-like glutamine amidotransferase